MTGNSVGQYYEAKMTCFQGSFSVGVMFLHVIFHKLVARVLPGFPNTREQWNSRGCLPSNFYCSREFVKHERQ